MPPKLRITKDDIIQAALEIVRLEGAQAINARTVASALHCSTQPVFSNFATMDELRLAVVEKADALCQAYMEKEISSGHFPPYKATGMAYIRFAKEERELFKLLYMRDRSGEPLPGNAGQFNEAVSAVQSGTGLSQPDAQLFHLEMWAYVHGIATMFATGFLNLDWSLVSKMLTDAYQGLRKQYGTE
jgi:AcrR family transcriptional regulator